MWTNVCYVYFFGIVTGNVQSTSSLFTVSNGVRQSGILSPWLFAVYVDDLSKPVHDARAGCFIEHQCINHVVYADDICIRFDTLLWQTELNRKKLFYHIHIESLLDRLRLDVTLKVYICGNNKNCIRFGKYVSNTHVLKSVDEVEQFGN